MGKILKGHTTIELTNSKTGETKVFENDNIVTNAISEYMQPRGSFGVGDMLDNYGYISTDNPDRQDYPIRRLTGGLMLLDSTIEENPETMFVPANVNQIAGGCTENNTTIYNNFGSYDNNNSGWIYNEDNEDWQEAIGYKHIWNFTEEQGNGTFKCACLTTDRGGKISDGLDIDMPTTSEWTTGYDENSFMNKNNLPVDLMNNDKTGIDRSIRHFPLTDVENNQFCIFGDSTLDTYKDFYPTTEEKIKMPIYYYRLNFNKVNILDNLTTWHGGSHHGADTVPYTKNLKNIEYLEMPDELDTWLRSLPNTSIHATVQTFIDKLYIDFHQITSGQSGLEGDTIHQWIIDPWAKTSTYKTFTLPFKILYFANYNLNTSNYTIFAGHYTSFIHLDNNLLLLNKSGDSTDNDYTKAYLFNSITNDCNELKLNNKDFKFNTTIFGNDAYPNNAGSALLKICDNKYVLNRYDGYRNNDNAHALILDTLAKKFKVINSTAQTCHSNSNSNFNGYCIDKNSGKGKIYNIYSADRWLYFAKIPNVIMTINNLDQPITKTDEFTMKVTYTLTRTDISTSNS